MMIRHPTFYAHGGHTGLRMWRVLVAIMVAGPVRVLGQAPDVAAPEPAPTKAESPEPAPDKTVERSVDDAVREAMAALTLLEDPGQSSDTRSVSDAVNEQIEFIRVRQPGNPWLPFLQGRIYAIVGRRRDAVEKLEQFTETREGRNEWLAYRMLGDLFVDQFPRLARAKYQEADALKRAEPSVLHGLSRCAQKLGEIGDGVRFAQAAVAADGGKTGRYLEHLARMLHAESRWDEAEQAAQSSLRIARESERSSPGRMAAQQLIERQYTLLVGILKDRLAQRGGRTRQVDHVLRLADYLVERGAVREQIARIEALKAIEAVVEQQKDPSKEASAEPRLLERYATLLAEVGRVKDARRAFQDLQQIDPTNPSASQWLARLQR